MAVVGQAYNDDKIYEIRMSDIYFNLHRFLAI